MIKCWKFHSINGNKSEKKILGIPPLHIKLKIWVITMAVVVAVVVAAVVMLSVVMVSVVFTVVVIEVVAVVLAVVVVGGGTGGCG